MIGEAVGREEAGGHCIVFPDLAQGYFPFCLGVFIRLFTVSCKGVMSFEQFRSLFHQVYVQITGKGSHKWSTEGMRLFSKGKEVDILLDFWILDNVELLVYRFYIQGPDIGWQVQVKILQKLIRIDGLTHKELEGKVIGRYHGVSPAAAQGFERLVFKYILQGAVDHMMHRFDRRLFGPTMKAETEVLDMDEVVMP